MEAFCRHEMFKNNIFNICELNKMHRSLQTSKSRMFTMKSWGLWEKGQGVILFPSITPHPVHPLFHPYMSQGWTCRCPPQRCIVTCLLFTRRALSVYPRETDPPGSPLKPIRSQRDRRRELDAFCTALSPSRHPGWATPSPRASVRHAGAVKAGIRYPTIALSAISLASFKTRHQNTHQASFTGDALSQPRLSR